MLWSAVKTRRSQTAGCPGKEFVSGFCAGPRGKAERPLPLCVVMTIRCESSRRQGSVSNAERYSIVVAMRFSPWAVGGGPAGSAFGSTAVESEQGVSAQQVFSLRGTGL